MKAYQRLLKYVGFDTESDDTSNTLPSTQGQFALAQYLKEELEELGLKEVYLSDKCYVYGFLPASPGYEGAPALGFLAHLDTSPDFTGKGVKPVITENYNGGDLPLGSSGRVLMGAKFPHLASLKGKTLITTDGTTLLGADDKAGIGEIITALEDILTGGIPHGKICVCITPDEETGRGTEGIELDRLGADYAYTVDGDAAGGIDYETFNAATAAFIINGFNVHPGSAKNIMINSALVAMEINSLLPPGETPADTEGYEGFYHLTDIRGDVEKTVMYYIVRDHDKGKFEERKEILRSAALKINEKYGEGTIRLEIREQYRNMREVIEQNYHLVENAAKAVRKAGLEPVIKPIRGGTDGAHLSFMGLPCPNLGTGGYAFHGPYEHITAEDMDSAVEIIIGIIKEYANFKKTEG